MPQNEEKTKKDKPQGEEAAEAAPKGGSGKKKLLLFGGIGLGVIVIGVAVALLVIKPMMADTPAEGASQEQSGQTAGAPHGAQSTEANSTSKESHSGGHGESAGGLIYAIKEIVVNPAGTGGSRFLSASVAFELNSPQLQATITAKEPIVRDALITILSSKTVGQLTDPKQREITRYQIKKRVSELLQTSDLAGVFFTDFVLQ